ncbi:PTS lactose/cellobiose transporter subunit IIA [Amphibacillus indicireducens]|uniref:PTS lichenan transporter subunit IIA n=1 Tax=Amphibacillus indicireducens TaxID=1076330 RepID=A0ABP7V0Q6_9BACI
MESTITETAFQIILHAGNGKSNAMEAIQEAKSGDFEAADNKLNEANIDLRKAHQFQTKLLQDEANGSNKEISIILIHAQDHLMTSMTVRDLAIEMIDLYRRL